MGKNGDEAEQGEEKDAEKGEKEEEKEVKLELTEEEKKLWFRKSAVSEISSKELSAVFTQFSIPEKTEGFSEVKFAFQTEKKAREYLTKWISQRKLTQRVEALQ